jgi:hypothetical protein
MAAVGLVQNFAALRTLVTEGIQKGHMALHARNIANSVGTPSYAISEVARYLTRTHQITMETAIQYLETHKLKREIRPSRHKPNHNILQFRFPSLLYFKSSQLGNQDASLILQVPFANMLETEPIIVSLTDEPQNVVDEIAHLLFAPETFDWILREFNLFDDIALKTSRPMRTNHAEKQCLKLLSLLINVVMCRLMYLHPKETRDFVRQALNQADVRQQSSLLSSLLLVDNNNDSAMRHEDFFLRSTTMDIFRADLLNSLHTKRTELLVGFPLLVALWQVFELRAVQFVGKQQLAFALIEEQRCIMKSIVSYSPILDSVYDFISFAEFMSLRIKHYGLTLLFLCDAMSLDETFITDTFLKHLLRLGHYFEWEAALAHDINCFDREKQSQYVHYTSNAFIFWLKRNGRELHRNHLEEFINEVIKTSHELHISEIEGVESLSDVNSFKKAIERVRSHYTHTTHRESFKIHHIIEQGSALQKEVPLS